MNRRYLEFSSGTSNKFWSIELHENSHTVTYGRIGAGGQSKQKGFKSEKLAKNSFDRLIAQKLEKGYEEKDWKLPAKKGAKQVTASQVKSADRIALEKVFRHLRKKGIISLQNAGFTKSDGFEDAMAAFERHPNPDQVVGFCFFHRQDSNGAKDGQGLHLAFGTARAEDEEKLGVTVGKMIREEFESAGFKVNWNGKLSQRLYLPDFTWFAPTTLLKKKAKASKKAKGRKEPVAKKPRPNSSPKVAMWMTGRKRSFERIGASGGELATIETNASQLIVWRGKEGAKGRTTTREFESREEALSEYARAINSDLLLKEYWECGDEAEHFILKVRALPKLTQAEQTALSSDYNALVPKSGQAESVHGELMRCVVVLQTQAESGNENWERGHRMMLDFLHTHLLSRCFSFTNRDDPLADLETIQKKSRKGKAATTKDFEKLSKWVLCWCRAHPFLIPHLTNPKLKV